MKHAVTKVSCFWTAAFTAFSCLFLAYPAYSGEPYTKTIYLGKNWKVIEAGLKGEFINRVVASSPHYLDSGKNPKFGMTVIKVTQSGKIVFAGENIGAYFKIAGKTTIQVDDTPPIAITPDAPFDAGETIKSMKRGKEVKVTVDFGSGGASIHTFKLAGFPEAYNKMINGK